MWICINRFSLLSIAMLLCAGLAGMRSHSNQNRICHFPVSMWKCRKPLSLSKIACISADCSRVEKCCGSCCMWTGCTFVSMCVCTWCRMPSHLLRSICLFVLIPRKWAEIYGSLPVYSVRLLAQFTLVHTAQVFLRFFALRTGHALMYIACCECEPA